VYANYAFSFTPGSTRAFWDVAGALSYDAKADHKLYFEVFRKIFPSVIGVPFISGRDIKAVNSVKRGFMVRKFYGAMQRLISPSKLGSLGTIIGIFPFGFVPSSFLTSELLVQDSEMINVDAAKRIFPARAPLANAAAKLLFHWKVWQLVHRNCLVADFQEYIST
jgi:hypothetical protein